MDKRLKKAQRLREKLSYAPPGACARLTRRLVRLMEDIAGG